MIWWLASYPKSGNTWLRYFLATYKNGAPLSLNNMYSFSMDDISDYLHQVVSPKPLGEMSQSDIMCCRPAALLHLVEHNPGATFYVKTHHALGRIAGFDLIPPTLSLGAFYLVRDPRDVVLSLSAHMRHESLDQSIECMSDPEWIIGKQKSKLFHALGSWSLNVKSWRHGSIKNTHAFRYEDLLEHPHDVFKAIVELCPGLSYDEDRLNMAIKASSFEAMKELEEKEGFKEKMGTRPFFYSGRSGGWKEVLTGKQVDKIITDHGEVMQKLGYEI